MGLFGLPNIGGSPPVHRWTILAILYGLVVLVGFLIHRFDHSQLGRAASAAFIDKDLTTSLGIDIKKLGILLQTFSCTLAGGCGVLYGFIYKSFHLDYFTFHVVGILMTVIFVGGYTTLWGTVLAAPILYGVPLALPAGDRLVAHRDLRGASHYRAGTQTRRVYHHAVRLPDGSLFIAESARNDPPNQPTGGRMKKKMAFGVLVTLLSGGKPRVCPGQSGCHRVADPVSELSHRTAGKPWIHVSVEHQPGGCRHQQGGRHRRKTGPGDRGGHRQ